MGWHDVTFTADRIKTMVVAENFVCKTLGKSCCSASLSSDLGRGFPRQGRINDVEFEWTSGLVGKFLGEFQPPFLPLLWQKLTFPHIVGEATDVFVERLPHNLLVHALLTCNGDHGFVWVFD